MSLGVITFYASMASPPGWSSKPEPPTKIQPMVKPCLSLRVHKSCQHAGGVADAIGGRESQETATGQLKQEDKHKPIKEIERGKLTSGYTKQLRVSERLTRGHSHSNENLLKDVC